MEKHATIEQLLEMLAEHGGKIVCTASLDVEQINQARASGRMYVAGNAIGYAWEPEIRRFPRTTREIKLFEKWFPLEVELPEGLKNLDWLHSCGGAKCKIPNCKVCKNQMY